MTALPGVAYWPTASRIMDQDTAGNSAVSRPPSALTETFSAGRTEVESSAEACQYGSLLA
jgi:hypothetical protein